MEAARYCDTGYVYPVFNLARSPALAEVCALLSAILVFSISCKLNAVADAQPTVLKHRMQIPNTVSALEKVNFT